MVRPLDTSPAAQVPRLDRRPELRTLSVADLVDRARAGVIRVPSFQRGDKWGGVDVRTLLDSIYRGYPIGELLMWQRPARAERVQLGPLAVDAPELTEAWWVVDGQQRITALAGTLTARRARNDPRFDVVFDVHTLEFLAATPDTRDAHVPVAVLLDATDLGEWLYTWPLGKDPDMRRRVLDAGSRLREYAVPVYVVSTPDEAVARDIFFRMNTAGQRLTWDEVHDALQVGTGRRDMTLVELGASLRDLNVGLPSASFLVRAILAAHGRRMDVSPALHERTHPGSLAGAAEDAGPAIRRALGFLRDRCAIRWVALVPEPMIVFVLVRFFALYPEPQARSLDLVSRWVWRAIDTDAPERHRALYANLISSAPGRVEDAWVQRLLQPTYGPRHSDGDLASKLIVPMDPGTAMTRLAVLALASLQPRHLETGAPIDIAGGTGAARVPVVAFWPGSDADMPWAAFLHPPDGFAAIVEARLKSHPELDPVWQSHAIDAEVLRVMRERRTTRGDRMRVLGASLQRLIRRHARWDEPARPSLAHLMAQAESDGTP